MPSQPSAPEIQRPVETPQAHVYHPASTTARRPATKILVGAWDAGFCSCLNFCVPNCFMAACCPWVSIAQIITRLGIYTYAKALLAMLALHVIGWMCVVMSLAMCFQKLEDNDDEGSRRHDENDSFLHLHTASLSMYEYLSAWHFVAFLCGVVYAVCIWQLRVRIRDRFQISGSSLSDFCAAGFCSCCAIAQMATHVKSYTPGRCDFRAPVDTLPAYA